MQVYVAGPVTGIEDRNKEAFYKADESLQAAGLEVVNPLKLCEPDLSWEQAMRICLSALLECESIVMLEGWEQSKGACIEHSLASALKIDIYYSVESLVIHRNMSLGVGTCIGALYTKDI